MGRLQDVIARGDRASQPVATSVSAGTLYFVTDEGVTERSDGTAWEAYSGAGSGVTPPPTPGATASTFLVSGGQVAWESTYTFRVSAASYYINGLPLTSAEATTTLGAADATLDRIDVITLDTAGAVVVVPGTASATPSEPSVDPAAALKLAIVLVTHATSAPPALATITVYAENLGTPAEWAWTASAGAIVLNSATTPHAGTITIEGTSVPAGVYAQGTTGAGAFDPTAYDHLRLFLRSKATWNNNRGLLVTLRAAGVLVGAAVQIRRSGTFGFDSTITTAYQQVAIPIPAFAVPQGTLIDQVRLEDFGGAIGFFVDDISFQVGATTSVGGGLSQDQADARYAPLVHHTAHDTGGSDAITALAASVITSGTIAGARLPARIGAIGLVIDGGGSAITTGTKGDVYIPFACTITASTLIADQTGSVVLDLKLSASYATTPTVSIVASAPPTLSSASAAQDTTLTGWTVSVAAGSRLRYSVTSASTLTRLTHTLTVQAT